MTSTRHAPRSDHDREWAHRPRPTGGRRVGYVVSIALNAVFLYIAHNLLSWEWPGFVTGAWNDVLPVMTVSLAATMAVTFVFIWFDPPWFKSTGNLITTAIGLVVAVRMWQVFPFDFTGYAVDWSGLARFVVGVSIAGMVIGLIAETLKLTTWLLRER